MSFVLFFAKVLATHNHDIFSCATVLCSLVPFTMGGMLQKRINVAPGCGYYVLHDDNN